MGVILNDCELKLHDKIAAELNRLAGVKLRLHSLNRGRNRDALYDEAEWGFDGPWEVYGIIEFNESDAVNHEAREQGHRTEGEATIWMARRSLDNIDAPHPKDGDVIEIWRDRVPDVNDKQDSGPIFFDVTKADRDGHVNDSPVTVNFKLTCKRRSEFIPERRTGAA